jgi:(S)-ureidoglycine aminohydrolase
MKIIAPFLICLASMAAPAQDIVHGIASGKYSWTTPKKKIAAAMLSSPILSGSSIDLALLQIDACTIIPSKKKTELHVPADQEYLIILRSGSLAISLGDTTSTIGPGSVAVLMPREQFGIQAAGGNGGSFYLMKYTAQPNTAGNNSGKSFVTDWNKLQFRPHDKGGVRKYFEASTAMFSRIEMHVTTLKAGLKSHEPHTHRPAEIILLLDGDAGQAVSTDMLIGDKIFHAGAGDFYYVEPNILHGITNTGTIPCSYFAFQFQ